MTTDIDPFNTVEEAKWRYKTAYIRQRAAEKVAEDYRKLDNYRHHRKFENLINSANELSVKTNLARRQMINLMEGQW